MIDDRELLWPCEVVRCWDRSVRDIDPAVFQAGRFQPVSLRGQRTEQSDGPRRKPTADGGPICRSPKQRFCPDPSLPPPDSASPRQQLKPGELPLGPPMTLVQNLDIMQQMAMLTAAIVDLDKKMTDEAKRDQIRRAQQILRMLKIRSNLHRTPPLNPKAVIANTPAAPFDDDTSQNGPTSLGLAISNCRRRIRSRCWCTSRFI